MLERRSTPTGLSIVLLLLIATLAATAPVATAEEEVDITMTMTSLSEADVLAVFRATGQEAQEFREAADQFFGNGDGTVQVEEADAMREAFQEEMDDEVTGDEDVTMDGEPFTLQIDEMEFAGLVGTSTSSTDEIVMRMTGTATLEAEPADQPDHTFTYTQDDDEQFVFQAPNGYEITSTENADAEGACHASTNRGNDDQVTIELTEAPGECGAPGSGAPGPGLLAGLLAAGLAALVLRKP